MPKKKDGRRKSKPKVNIPAESYRLLHVAAEVLGVITIGLFVFTVIIFTVLNKSFTMPETECDQLFKRFWEWRLKDSPEFATFSGFHDHDDALESYDLKAFDERKNVCEHFLKEAEKLLSEETLHPSYQQNLKLFSAELNSFISGIHAKGYLFPLNNLEGPQVELERLIPSMKFENAGDYRKLLSRFKRFPQQISEIIGVFNHGIKLNMTYHKTSIDKVVDQINDILITELDKSPFLKPLQNLPESIDLEEKLTLISEAEDSLRTHIIPSFHLLKDFLETEYFKHLRSEAGISSLPDGKKFYQMCLDFHLGIKMTPEEVHHLGLEEINRITKEMEKVVEKLGLKQSLSQFSHSVKAKKHFYYNNEKEMFDAYQNIVFKKIQPKLPQIIKNIPTLKLNIEPTPHSMAAGPVAFYLGGTPDGSRPGVFYINTAHVESSPKYEAVTLSLHEAEPGHHLQISYMLEMPNVPSFRQYIEDRKYSVVPSRFLMHTSYLEGWGLYSEYLGYELNLYDDPYLEYGHLSYEMFRACRLVVDTGIHAFGWSMADAVKFMVNHTGMHEDAIQKEISRYVTWPGQACAYKIGEIKIKELRKKAEAELGSNFDVREFHDVVLQSAGPLHILEQNVNDFIKKVKSS